MKKELVFSMGILIVYMLSTIVLAEQIDNASPTKQQTEQPKSLVDTAKMIKQPNSGKTRLSKRNRAKIEQTEQQKLRQIEINKQLANGPQSK